MSAFVQRRVVRPLTTLMKQSRMMSNSVTFTVVGPEGFRQEINTVVGRPLFKTFQAHKIDYLPCVCNGQLACTTCHVKFEGDVFYNLPALALNEMDMLDIAGEADDYSRLSCQLVASTAMNGCTITIPDMVVNHMDDPSGTAIPTRLLKKQFA